MKFAKVIGKVDKDLVRKAEDKLSAIFTELSLGYDNKSMGTGIGGDPLVFQLVYPIDHICDALAIQLDELKKKEKEIEKRVAAGETVGDDEKIPDEVKKFRKQMGGRVLRTAATDGRRYYWNPQFVVDQNKLGLRIVVAHEAWHAIYMHPSRRGSRLPRLWNIAVDYKVNFTVMEDLKSREIKDYTKVFSDNLGEYILLEEYAAFLRDPFNPPPRLAHLNPILALKKMADPAYKDPHDDTPPMYYADPNLSEDMKRPENVYDYLLAQIPKCPKCGRLGKYKKPEEYKQLQKKIQEQQKKKKAEENKKKAKEAKEEKKLSKIKDPNSPDCCKDPKEESDQNTPGECNHEHGEGEACNHPSQDKKSQPSDRSGDQQSDDGCCEGGCSECGGDDSTYVDPFGAGETLDDHVDSDISEEELGKRITDAMEIAKKMAGKVPGALEDELGQLLAPKLTWEDFVRSKMLKARNGFGKSDWTRPKSRPLFAGLYSPKKRDYFVKFLFGYDCSGSMSNDDIAHGVSQAQVIDERGEGFLVPWDAQTYWEDMVPIKKATAEELARAKVVGRGGTHISSLFNEYEEKVGKVDMIIIATDGFLYDNELTDCKVPKGVDVIWIITSHNPNFKPPFGRVFNLRNE
jgi:predicted metal-dependent peptidase